MPKATKTKKKNKRRRAKRSNQKGGLMPFFVDPVKAVNVSEELIESFRKPQTSVKEMKRRVKSYKQQYADYKRRGGKDSLETWGVKKGIMKKAPLNCSIVKKKL